MNLIKTSFLNGLAVTVKLFSQFIINKALAYWVGPKGYVAIGQLQNAIQVLTTFSSGAINTGVTKYTAENYANEKKQIQLWQSSGKLIICGSIFFSSLLFLFRKELSILFFKDEHYSFIFLFLSPSLILFNLNILLQSILTGKKEIRIYISSNIAGSLFSLILVVALAYYWRLDGALVGLVTYQSLTFFVTFFLCIRTNWFKLDYLYGQLNKEILSNLSKYTLMALTSAAVVPVSQILIRRVIEERFSVEVAGYWEAMNRLSSSYLILVTSTLTIYFLPRFSEITDLNILKLEAFKAVRNIFPFATLGLISVYMFREFLIKILFTDKFMPMENLIMWQLAGDLFKILGWVLAYALLSKTFTKVYIFSEIIFAALAFLLTLASTSFYDVNYIQLGFFINYLCYFLFLSFFVKRNFSRLLNE